MHTGLQTQGGFSADAQTDFVEGAVVGSWRVEGELGHGGMSTVYAVVHTEIGKRAALKVVHGHVLSARFTAEHVILEAQVVNRIGHDGIVDIFEAGTLPDGRPFLVMERLEGTSLAQRSTASAIGFDEAIKILLQLCGAVGAAHDAGVVHCDLKPDNVFLETTGSTKVLDWGIAHLLTTSCSDELVIGTPQYLSPEQANGGAITGASDIYSLGVIAYGLFLDKLPFESETAAELLMMHLRDAPPAPRIIWPEIPPALEALLLSMLAKKPAARPTASEVARQLTAIRKPVLQGARVSTAPKLPALAMTGLRSSTSRVISRPGVKRAGGIAALAALVVVGIAALWSNDPARASPIVETASRSPLAVAPKPMPPIAVVSAAPPPVTVVAAPLTERRSSDRHRVSVGVPTPAASPVVITPPRVKAPVAPVADATGHAIDPNGTIDPYL